MVIAIVSGSSVGNYCKVTSHPRAILSSHSSVLTEAIRIITLVLLLAVPSMAASSGEIDPVIREILEIQGVERNVRQTIRAQIREAKVKHPAVPPATWAEVERRVQSTDLTRDLARIWKDVFTPAELRQVLIFLRTPAGKKLLGNQQLITAKSGAVAGLWGMDVYAILQAKHPDQFPPNKPQDQQMRSLFLKTLGREGAR